MDPKRFDTLTRTLSAGKAVPPTRRAVLATLAAALVAVGSGHVPAAAKKRKCKGGTLKCNKVCVDPQNDFSNCGTCGNVCGQGQSCDGGTCVGGGGGGDCDPPCGFNAVCQDGACVAAANRCPAPFDCPDPFGGPAPVCGTVAGPGGGTCGCFASTEGNNVCLNETDSDGEFIDSATLVPCTDSQECRDTVGFHFYCRAVTTSPSGKTCGSEVSRCWPECDNPSVGFAKQERSGKRATAARRKQARDKQRR
jgi:hypothetical protein